MAGGRKGSHKGKSHQKKTSSESNEETTCAAQDTNLFLDAPSNPVKRSRIEETDEFNPLRLRQADRQNLLLTSNFDSQ